MKKYSLIVLLLGLFVFLSCSGGGGGGAAGGSASFNSNNEAPGMGGAPQGGGGAVTATGTSSGTHTTLTQPSVPASSSTISINLTTQTATIPSSLASTVSVTSATETVNSTSTTIITVSSTSSEVLTYSLSGTLSNGMFYVKNSSSPYVIELNNANITSTVTPAMLLKKAAAYIKTNSGTTNTFADNRDFTNASANYGDYDQKGAIHTAKDLVLSGSGTLTVSNAKYKSGIYSKGLLSVIGGTINVTSVGKSCMGADNGFLMWNGTVNLSGNGTTTDDETKGIKVDGDESSDGAGLGYIVINGGTINSTTQSKGITAGWDIDEDATTSSTSDDPNPYVEINGGTINITTLHAPYENSTASCSPEGIEGKAGLTINGGTITLNCTDDAINAGGNITINGGAIYAYSSMNDAIDSNGSKGITINGGVVVALGLTTPECAFDCDQNPLTINGGTLIGLGTSNYTAPKSGKQSAFVLGSSSLGSAGTSFAVVDQSGKPVFVYTLPSKTGDIAILSSPDIKTGTSYSVKTGVTLSGGTKFHNLYTSLPEISGGTSSLTSISTSSSNTVYTDSSAGNTLGGQGGPGQQEGPGGFGGGPGGRR